MSNGLLQIFILLQSYLNYGSTKSLSGIKGKTPIFDPMGIYSFTGPFERIFNYGIWIECRTPGKKLTCLWLINALMMFFQVIQRKRKICNGTIFLVNEITNTKAQWSLFETNIYSEISFW